MILLDVESKQELEQIIERSVKKSLTDISYPEETTDKLLTRTEAAKYLSISLGTLHAHTKSGKIIGQRIGCRLLYRKSDLDKSFTSTIKQ